MKEKASYPYPGLVSILTGEKVSAQWALQLNDQSFAGPLDLYKAAGVSMTGSRVSCCVSSEELIEGQEFLSQMAKQHIPFVLHAVQSTLHGSQKQLGALQKTYYHLARTGVVQLYASNPQEVADLTLIAHRVAQEALVPVVVAQDYHVTSSLMQQVRLPEKELIDAFLGHSSDEVSSATPAQRLIFGAKRRRIPQWMNLNQPMHLGAVHQQKTVLQNNAAEREFYAKPIDNIIDQACKTYENLTGRTYDGLKTYQANQADYLLVVQGALLEDARAVAMHLSQSGTAKVGVVGLTVFRPLPALALSTLLKGKKGVVVLERADQFLMEEGDLTQEIRAILQKSLEGGLAHYHSLHDVPQVYCGYYGLGCASVKHADIIAAIKNMLPQGDKKKTFYLSPQFVRNEHDSPKQEIHQQSIVSAFDKLDQASVTSQSTLQLIPDDACVMRFQWHAKSSLNDVLPSVLENIAQLTQYGLRGLPEPDAKRVIPSKTTNILWTKTRNVGLHDVWPVDLIVADEDLLSSGKINLKNVKKGSVVLVLSKNGHSELLSQTLSESVLQKLNRQELKVMLFDFQRFVDEEYKRQIALHGISSVFMADVESKILTRCLLALAMEFSSSMMDEKSWKKVAAEMSLNKMVSAFKPIQIAIPLQDTVSQVGLSMPLSLKKAVSQSVPMVDLHRFWPETGMIEQVGEGARHLADPFMGAQVLPAKSSLVNDVTEGRKSHPVWDADLCTGCGECWMICPDSALPARLLSFGDVCETVVSSLEKQGHDLTYLQKSLRVIDGKMSSHLTQAGTGTRFEMLLDSTLEQALSQSTLKGDEQQKFEKEVQLFQDTLSQRVFSLTDVYSKKQGSLLALAIDPTKCTGCDLCVASCEVAALSLVEQTQETLKPLQNQWNFFQSLPNTNPNMLQIDEESSDLQVQSQYYLSDAAYHTVVGGDFALPGTLAKTAVHLFAGATTAILQKRYVEFASKLMDLKERLQQVGQLGLSVKLDQVDQLQSTLNETEESGISLAELTAKMDTTKDPVDVAWLRRVTSLLQQLSVLHQRYATGQESALLGLGGADSSVAWAGLFPFQPFGFPFMHFNQLQSPALAEGLFEGMMGQFAQVLKVVRMAELEIEGKYNPLEHDAYFNSFSWKDFTDEERKLCPPVLYMGSDSDIYGRSFTYVMKLLENNYPVKILVFDSLQADPGLSLTGLQFGNAYVYQGGVGNMSSLVKGFVDGMNTWRPALYQVFTSQAHVSGESRRSLDQSVLALKSRCYPVYSYHPERGEGIAECLDLSQTPELDDTYYTHQLTYLDAAGLESTVDVALTFADFAALEGSFENEFKKIVDLKAAVRYIPVSEYLELDPEERLEVRPMAYGLSSDRKLVQLEVSSRMIEMTEKRNRVWNLLHTLRRMDAAAAQENTVIEQTKQGIIDQLTKSLTELAENQELSQSA